MAEHVDDLHARIAALEAKIERLEARDEPQQGSADPTPERPVSRRRLLGMAGAATAGAVGATVLAASPAGATSGNMQFGAPNAAGTDVTGLTSSNGDSTLDVANTGSGDAISVTVTGGGDGVNASATTSNGVSGFATSGTGVQASSTSGAAFTATSTSGRAIVAALGISQAGAHLDLIPHGTVSGPPTGSHNAGQFWMDATATLWQCVVTGNPAKWVRQSPLVLLASPFRVYDSRAGQGNPSGSPQGALAFGVERTINCTPALPSGITVASGLLMNVTLANTVGAKGAISVYSAAVSAPPTSSVNWAAVNTNIANAVTSACDSSQDIKVKCVSTAGSSTHVIIDVIGYYP